MELTMKVKKSLIQWEQCWANNTVQLNINMKRKHHVLLSFRQWWTYRKIKRISKKCFRVLRTDTDPQMLMLEMENDALTLLELILDVPRSECTDLIRSTYADATKGFVDEAKLFDPELDAESVFQALRNVWIMHSIQVLHDMEPKHTDSIFGYSMLYPLTDNFLDDQAITKEEKIEFNRVFRRRLEGEALSVESKELIDIFEMIERMESDFPRSQYPDVWESILLIQSAQENSLRQQGEFGNITKKEIKSLSFRKGGTSVLADGFLVCGELTTEWVHFLIGYGILLQLADDLQDLYTDAEAEHWTLFSIHHKNVELDQMVLRLRNFAQIVFNSYPVDHKSSNKSLLKVMQKAIDYLIYDATVNIRYSCKKSYITTIEKQFPVNASQQLKLNITWKSMIQFISHSKVSKKVFEQFD